MNINKILNWAPPSFLSSVPPKYTYGIGSLIGLGMLCFTVQQSWNRWYSSSPPQFDEGSFDFVEQGLTQLEAVLQEDEVVQDEKVVQEGWFVFVPMDTRS